MHTHTYTHTHTPGAAGNLGDWVGAGNSDLDSMNGITSYLKLMHHLGR